MSRRSEEAAAQRVMAVTQAPMGTAMGENGGVPCEGCLMDMVYAQPRYRVLQTATYGFQPDPQEKGQWLCTDHYVEAFWREVERAKLK